MTFCINAVDIEDYVLGTLPAARARELRVHLANCAECRKAESEASGERALFAMREPLVVPPAALAVQLRARLRTGAGTAPTPPRFAWLRARGYALMGAAAACAALFAVVRGMPAASPNAAPGAATRLGDPPAYVSIAPVPKLECNSDDPPSPETFASSLCNQTFARSCETSCERPSASDTIGE